MRRVLILIMASMVLTFARQVPAGGDDAAVYLGPRPGTKLFFEYKNGVRVERSAFSGNEEAVIIEERSYYPPEITPTGEPMTGTSTYKLLVDGPRLVQVRDTETILLDLGVDGWTSPLGGGEADPSEMQCRVQSRGEREILGENRKVADVFCTYVTSNVNVDTAYTLAESLGIVRLAVSSGDKVFSEMKLVKIEEEFWRTGDKP